MKDFYAIGIDPAIRNTGVCIARINPEIMTFEVVNLFLIETENEAGKTVRKNSDDLRRARMIARTLQGHADTYNCKVAFAEIPSGSQSARAMFSNGICVGVLAGFHLPIIEVMPAETKLAAVGHKQAAKEEMIEWAMKQFPDAPWLVRRQKGELVAKKDNEHLADAVAIVKAGMRTEQFKLMAQVM